MKLNGTGASIFLETTLHMAYNCGDITTMVLGGFSMVKTTAGVHCSQWKYRVAVISLLFVCGLLPLTAFQFSPLEQEFESTGVNSQKTYTIINDTDDRIAVRITAAIRDQDETGAEINRPATGYFTIVPQQVVVNPRSSYPVRIQYRGPRTATAEQAFRIIAEQQAYSQGRSSQGQGMFSFQFTYNAAAYVLPSQTVIRIAAPRVEVTTRQDGSRALAVTIQNLGNVHQLLDDARLTLTADGGGASYVLTGEDLGTISGMNILARKTVTITIDWPTSIPTGVTALSVADFTYTRR